ncbi:MAG: beta-N-acetylhexosaminidase [Bacteroidales bacterium]|nr:beta-N-acetylhexosaminidase [Bacteroidales bacterium]
MNKTILTALLAFCTASTATWAQSAINLTPAPAEMIVGKGEVVLPTRLVIGVDRAFGDSILVEAQRFAEALESTMPGYSTAAGINPKRPFIEIAPDAKLASEAYTLDIRKNKITIKASTTDGVYYALQSIKKMLPANVMAGVKAEGNYTLPIVRINDQPRFAYRGFMLDVSRHFHGIDEIKRLLDIMAAYKMNVFHWHLTDDQGWRAEIKKYPRLTTVGSKSQNCRITDMEKGTYWTNEPYGPHFYTQEEMREVVAYAAERHIDVLPEVDMPGHFVAALASYPEFSCNPRGQHNVLTHQGGVWEDVLNVGNPRAVQFAKDILAELCDIFPYPYIHIGGDECPTKAWENNAECLELYKQLGVDSYRKLQSHFIKDISDFIQTRGKHLFVWNESVTCEGADLDLIRESGSTVMSWHPCQQGARTAAELGLKTIVTEYHSKTGGYYINRRQSKDDPYDGAGYGDDTVRGCYEYVPVPEDVPAELSKYYIGVQATFWTEWVSNTDYLEYLALPRLICVAEAAWSPQSKKNWEDFKHRLTLDLPFLDYGHYNYGKHWLEQ